MDVEIILMAKCDNCGKTRKVANIVMRKHWGSKYSISLCTYCVIELNNAILVPPDRKPKAKAEKQR